MACLVRTVDLIALGAVGCARVTAGALLGVGRGVVPLVCAAHAHAVLLVEPGGAFAVNGKWALDAVDLKSLEKAFLDEFGG